MKVQVEMSQEVLAAIMNGKFVEGSLRLQLSSMGTHSEVGFRPYNRKPRVKYHDRVIHRLEHGWVKESKERIKLFESVPKELGTARILAVIDRETKEAKNSLIDHELDMLEFC